MKSEALINETGESGQDSTSILKINKFGFITKFFNLKSLDFFGVSFDFRLENHKKYYSKTAGFWFLIYFIMGMIYSFYEIKEFFLAPSFETFEYHRYLHEKPFDESINIFKENFTFGIIPPRINHENFSDFFVIEGSYYNRTKKIGSNEDSQFFEDKIELKKVVCDESNFFYFNPTKSKKKRKVDLSDYGINKDNMVCFERNPKFILGGYNFNEALSYFKINIKINEKYLEKKDEILSSYQEELISTFKFIYTDIFVDFDDYFYFDKISNYFEEEINRIEKKKIEVLLQRYSYNQYRNIFWKYEEKRYYTKLNKFYVSNINYQNDYDENRDISNDATYVEFTIKAIMEYKKIKRTRERILTLQGRISSVFIKNFLILKMIFLYLNTRKAKNFILNQFIDDEKHKKFSNNVHYNDLCKLIKDNVEHKNFSFADIDKKYSNKNFGKLSDKSSDLIFNVSELRSLDKENKIKGTFMENREDYNDSKIIKLRQISDNISNYDMNFKGKKEVGNNLSKNKVNKKMLLKDNIILKLRSKSSKNIEIDLKIEKKENELEKDENSKKKNLHEKNNIKNFDKIYSQSNNREEVIFSTEMKIIGKNAEFNNENYLSENILTDNKIKNEEINTNNFLKNNIKSYKNIGRPQNTIKSGSKIIRKSESFGKQGSIKSKISLCRFLRFLICCNWKRIIKEKKYYIESEKKFDQFINIKHFMRKIGEIDVIKYILLDENMLFLNNYISRSSILQNQEGKLKSNYELYFERNDTNSDIYSLDFEKLKISYSNLKNKLYISEVENKILDLFEYQYNNVTKLPLLSMVQKLKIYSNDENKFCLEFISFV